ncbi:exo-alpha-sialidase [Actinomyces bowdenii]|uniref:exo-alpha-sialidase n=1 Tax=Actinomyces bowdenii TaxID=131109 RepID=UPI00214B0B08|nr:exo-alpha-sialidase [Actinomyces bowdenii]MCR2052043.1 exo-alpha-sialidase [Actinomyces bowdenii]
MNSSHHDVHALDATASRGSITFDVRARASGPLLRLLGAEGRSLTLRLADSRLLYEVRLPERHSTLDAEDVRGLDDGQWHSVALTAGPRGTRLYIDGYQAFCGTTTAFLADLGALEDLALGGAGAQIESFTVHPGVLSSREVLALARPAVPEVEFAASDLSAYDVERLAGLRRGSLSLRFRSRGRGQHGVILAASGRGGALSLAVGPHGLTYRLSARDGAASSERVVEATGQWSQGQWHDVALVVGHGAVDLYVDGFREAHSPGEFFLGDVQGLERIVVGQDHHGVRLAGEVARAGIHTRILNDAQVKRLSGVEPIETDAVFDRGYRGSASYRIPSILALASGTVLAGADQRVSSPNDAPNDINFVVRRSLDGGVTWQEPTTVIDCPGTGQDAANVIDSCMVQDPGTGRIHVLIDHFPGGIGQPHCWASVGFDEQGRMLLRDRQEGRYALEPDGAVVGMEGESTPWRVGADGGITRQGSPAGNIALAPGADPDQELGMIPTSYLLHLYSDDDGRTWSEPRHLNPQVKEPWMRFLGTGPGNGIALRHGEHRGRLVIPVYFNNEANWLAMCATVLYSDDHGETWSLGRTPNTGRPTPDGALDPAAFTDEAYSLHEATVIERHDGSLMLLMRNQAPEGRVAVALSQDGGSTWGQVAFDEDLPEIWCQPNAISLPSPAGQDRVVFANASLMLPYRGCGVLRLSLDGGRTWHRSRTLNPGHHVYQCLCPLPDGALGVLWENEYQGLYLSRVPLSWFGLDLEPAEVPSADPQEVEPA